MTIPILALRVSRRVIAAVSVADDGFAYCDGHHLTSRNEHALQAVVRYMTDVLDLAKPTRVLIDAPRKESGRTATMVALLTELLTSRGVSYEIRTTADLLHAFGVPALRTRAELRRLAEALWPDLPPAVGWVKPFVLEAAAVSLDAETAHALGPLPP